jgi:tRNA-specific 2-thiouridylase
VNVLVAMSGGVDSSVAAALLAEAGHDVTGVTMKLWGGDADTGCCSVADVDDARRVAQQLDIDHLVFGFADEFEARVVEPYVRAHQHGSTPNPCIECNRHLKFGALLRRADALGFDAVATGHHARVVERAGRLRLCRGVDAAKDQSYVLHVVEPEVLARVLLPIGELTKDDVRAHAARLGLRTAGKPDSQDVCFITSTGGRRAFLGDHIPLRPATVVDRDGRTLGDVDAVELVTVGQRRGLALAGAAAPRYALEVDVDAGVVVAGSREELLVDGVVLADARWSAGAAPVGALLDAQCSAHGRPRRARLVSATEVRWVGERHPRVAPGQSVVLYDGDEVAGGGVAAGPAPVSPRAEHSART